MSRSGARRFTCRGGASGSPFRPHRLARRGGTRGRRTVRGGASGLTRERAARHGAVRFALEHPRYRTRDARPAVGFAFVLARGIGICGASARARLGLAFPRRAERNACAPRLRQPDGGGLLGRSGPLFAPAGLSGLLVHGLATLGGLGVPRPLVLAGLRDCSLLRHHHSPLRPGSFCDPIPRGAVALAWAPSPMVSTPVLSI